MVLYCEYQDQGIDLDDELEKTIGERCGSGYNMQTRVRGIQFVFDTISQLRSAQRIIRSNPKLSSIKMEVHDD